jgi:hypothetical protein
MIELPSTFLKYALRLATCSTCYETIARKDPYSLSAAAQSMTTASCVPNNVTGSVRTLKNCKAMKIVGISSW